MSNLRKKEEILYNLTVSKTNDRDFFIAFHNYFNFLATDFLDILTDCIIESVHERMQDKKEVDELYKKITDDVTKAISEIESLIKKLKIQDNALLQDCIESIKKLLNGESRVFGGEVLDSVDDWFVDMFRELIKLGHAKHIKEYVELSEDDRIKSVNILEKRKEFYAKRNGFIKKDARSQAGAFFRLSELFVDIIKQEKGDVENVKINIVNFLEIHNKKHKETEYGQLMSGGIQSGKHYSRANYLTDIEIVHNAITFDSLDTDSHGDKIFYTKDNDIYHYKIGKMHYDLNGLKEPNYIKMFRNIINYMPAGKDKIRISELEKNINKKDKCGNSYRANLGKSAKSFNNFLKKNGVQNIHPETRNLILSVTDEFISFYNNI